MATGIPIAPVDVLNHYSNVPGQDCKSEKIMKWYLKVLKNYAIFNGRARRKEYWMFLLVNTIIAGVIGAILGFIAVRVGNVALVNWAQLYNLALLIPSVAVGVRRMHDTDHSGWWLLCPVVNLVYLFIPGTVGENRFGDDPKAATIGGSAA
ncbi:DUF805 domain-containing protein [Burkholderia paludis]|uniref:DUF805 domain-containing protein n=1 Tax=Burkholderia paludis TaxID=1506587 RepID=UPI0022363E11